MIKTVRTKTCRVKTGRRKTDRRITVGARVLRLCLLILVFILCGPGGLTGRADTDVLYGEAAGPGVYDPAGSAKAAGERTYGGAEAVREAELSDLKVEWEEIPELVRRGNPAWLELSSDTAREKESTTAACEAFRAELYEDVELIDESLEEIRIRKAELKELPGTQTVDETGTTAAEEIRRQEATEQLLKEQRREIIRAVGAVVVPVKDAVRKSEESLEPQLESIILGVRETLIARQQLKLQRDAFAARTGLLRAQADAAAASFARGMISEAEAAEAESRAAGAEADLADMDASLEKVDRSLNRSLGFDADAPTVYEAVPVPEKNFRDGLSRESELEKLYAGSRELKDLTDPKSFSAYGTDKLWQAAVNDVKASLTAEWDRAWEALLNAEKAVTDAESEHAEAERKLLQARDRFAAGKISRISLMETEASAKEAEASYGEAALSLRKAQEQYRKTCTPTDR